MNCNVTWASLTINLHENSYVKKEWRRMKSCQVCFIMAHICWTSTARTLPGRKGTGMSSWYFMFFCEHQLSRVNFCAVALNLLNKSNKKLKGLHVYHVFSQGTRWCDRRAIIISQSVRNKVKFKPVFPAHFTLEQKIYWREKRSWGKYRLNWEDTIRLWICHVSLVALCSSWIYLFIPCWLI